jgi:hypothetical protein
MWHKNKWYRWYSKEVEVRRLEFIDKYKSKFVYCIVVKNSI